MEPAESQGLAERSEPRNPCFDNVDIRTEAGAAKLAGVVGYVQNEQTDPYRLTLDQRPTLLTRAPMNCSSQAAAAALVPGAHYEHVYDLRSLEQNLARKPANSIAA